MFLKFLGKIRKIRTKVVLMQFWDMLRLFLVVLIWIFSKKVLKHIKTKNNCKVLWYSYCHRVFIKQQHRHDLGLVYILNSMRFNSSNIWLVVVVKPLFTSFTIILRFYCANFFPSCFIVTSLYVLYIKNDFFNTKYIFYCKNNSSRSRRGPTWQLLDTSVQKCDL